MIANSQLARHPYRPRRSRIELGGETDAGAGFHLGLITAIAPEQVPPNAICGGRNVVLGLGGEVESRAGTLFTATASGTPQIIFEWRGKDKMIVQIGTGLYKTAAVGGGTSLPGWGTLTLITNFTTSARCAAVEFNGKLVVCHPVDGVFDYDDTTWTLRNATVKGDTIAVWTNKVWVSGVDTTVWWSNAGTSATWTTGSDFNKLLEVNDERVTALIPATGQDFQGRGGLIALKERAVHRIHDATSGAYTTLDRDAGAFNHKCAVELQGVIFFCGPSGAFTLTGLQVSRVSDNVQDLWSRGKLNLTNSSLFSCGIVRERFRFSYQTVVNAIASGTEPNETLEFDPFVNEGQGAWMPAMSLGFRCWTRYTKGRFIRTFAGGKPGGSDGVTEIEPDTGRELGAAANVPLRWFAKFPIVVPTPGAKARLRDLHIVGRNGSFARMDPQVMIGLDYNDPTSMLENPQFEDDTSTWAAFGSAGAALSRVAVPSDVPPGCGDWCARILATLDGSGIAGLHLNGTSNYALIEPGYPYSLRVLFKRQSATPVDATIKLNFWDETLTNFGFSSNFVTLATQDWYEVTLSGAYAQGGDPGLSPTRYVEVQCYVAGSNGTSVDVLIDRIYLHQAGDMCDPPRDHALVWGGGVDVGSRHHPGLGAGEAFQVVIGGFQADPHSQQYGRGDYAVHRLTMDLVPLS